MQIRRRNPDDDLTSKVIEETIKEMRLMAQEKHWGERCNDYDEGCIACRAWKHFDETGEIAK